MKKPCKTEEPVVLAENQRRTLRAALNWIHAGRTCVNRATAQALIRGGPTGSTRVRPYGICGRWSGTAAGFQQLLPVLPS
jgi:hypothetical protein